MKKLSVTIAGHRTSITLEAEFADALFKIAEKQTKSVSELIREIDEACDSKNLSSAIRVFVLKHKI